MLGQQSVKEEDVGHLHVLDKQPLCALRRLRSRLYSFQEGLPPYDSITMLMITA